MMFSATFDGTVGGLAAQLTHDAQRIRISAPTEQHTGIEQRLHWADNRSHRDALLDQILTDRNIEQAVVFTSTQRDADELADRLSQIGHSVAALHGGMPQGRRNRVLGALRMKQLKVLVATDVAARGIDVPTITHVINYGLPMKAEDYVHRIGRTGRAGASGDALSLCSPNERKQLAEIENLIKRPLERGTLVIANPSRPSSSSADRSRPSGGRGRDEDSSRSDSRGDSRGARSTHTSHATPGERDRPRHVRSTPHKVEDDIFFKPYEPSPSKLAAAEVASEAAQALKKPASKRPVAALLGGFPRKTS